MVKLWTKCPNLAGAHFPNKKNQNIVLQLPWTHIEIMIIPRKYLHVYVLFL